MELQEMEKLTASQGLQAISPGSRQRTRGKRNETEAVPALDPAFAGSRAGTGGESSPDPTVAMRLPSANGFNLFEVGGVYREVSEKRPFAQSDAPCSAPDGAILVS